MQCSMYGAMYRTRNGHAQHQFKVASQLINIITTTSVMGVITITIDVFLSMIMIAIEHDNDGHEYKEPMFLSYPPFITKYILSG